MATADVQVTVNDVVFDEEETKAPRKRVRHIVADDDEIVDVEPIFLLSMANKMDSAIVSIPVPQPHTASPLRPFKKLDAPQLVTCTVAAVNGPAFDLQFVPCRDDKAVQIFGDTFPLKDWLKHHLSAKWDNDHKCWTVPLTKDLTYGSVVFRVKYCASRSWKQVPDYVRRWFLTSFRVRTFSPDMSRVFDEKEHLHAANNKATYWKKAYEQAKGKDESFLFPYHFANSLCGLCGYDFFFHKCPDTYPNGCPGCGKSWDN